ncbi:MAG: HD domain-containing protein [Pirellulales bacterium]
MGNPHRQYEIRCPIHGFVALNDWEREIISQAPFQRLRRIRQLAWTDLVYPGAMHTRFEHSLGVMHVATQLYDAIVERSRGLLETELAYNGEGLQRDRALVRLTALLHDVGHAPFSHAAEGLFPNDPAGKKYEHEDYSAAVITDKLRNAIEDHPLNQNFGLRAENVAALLHGSAAARRSLFWRELITGQIDADRIDYLLRDSHHAGVDYGRFGWRRLLCTVEAVPVDEGPGDEGSGLRLGVAEGGWHAAEALVLARYFMFTQVYFHKTRVAFNHHLFHALAEILPDSKFPCPTGGDLDRYLEWDDWRVLGALAGGGGGEHGRRIAERNHFREAYHTPENPKPKDLRELKRVRTALGALLRAEEHAEKSWYKVGSADIPVASDDKQKTIRPLSDYSSVVASIKPIRKVMLFVDHKDKDAARERIAAAETRKARRKP